MSKDKDITDTEWNELWVPYSDNLNNYITKYIIPSVIAFQLANSYYRNCLCKATLLQHYNSMKDIILITTELENVKGAITEILHINYNLKIVNENPLILEKWQ